MDKTGVVAPYGVWDDRLKVMTLADGALGVAGAWDGRSREIDVKAAWCAQFTMSCREGRIAGLASTISRPRRWPSWWEMIMRSPESHGRRVQADYLERARETVQAAGLGGGRCGFREVMEPLEIMLGHSVHAGPSGDVRLPDSWSGEGMDPFIAGGVLREGWVDRIFTQVVREMGIESATLLVGACADRALGVFWLGAMVGRPWRVAFVKRCKDAGVVMALEEGHRTLAGLVSVPMGMLEGVRRDARGRGRPLAEWGAANGADSSGREAA